MYENQTSAESLSNIRYLSIPKDILVFSIFDSDSYLKQHSDYRKAKAGNFRSALNLISDLAWLEMNQNKTRFATDCIFVSPFARESTGDNAIPQVMAEVFALVCGATADRGLVQVTNVYHTGADPMERLALRPEFEGPVVSGANYVLLDDVVSLGGTLAELAHYVQFNGGVVSDIAVIVNAGRNKSLSPDHKTLRILNERFGNEIIEIFGIHIDALTANEAQYLVGFRSVDEIRNRLTKAKKESNLRLRSKRIAGLFRSEDG
jgi:hypothetical protein